MKTVIVASALTLVANLALAHDYQQGNFAGPDLTPGFSTVSAGEFRPVVKSNVRVSLQDYYAGNPGRNAAQPPLRAWSISSPWSPSGATTS